MAIHWGDLGLLRLSRGTYVRWTWISHFNFRVRIKNTKVGNHHGVRVTEAICMDRPAQQ